MALKTTWNHSDTSNRLITEPLNVKYTTDEIFYEVSPKGDGSPPAYVTAAETALTDLKDDLSDALDDIDDLEPSLTAAETAKNTAFSTWYANQNLANYRAYITACTNYGTVKSQMSSLKATANNIVVNIDTATRNLDAANEQWANESQSVEYKGGRFLGYEHHRIARMSMRYFGFSLSAATSCKSYFDSLYTRSICKTATFNEGVVEILHQTANPSSVRIVKAGGDNYTVEIVVYEDDVALSTTAVEPSTLFTTENARVYL